MLWRRLPQDKNQDRHDRDDCVRYTSIVMLFQEPIDTDVRSMEQSFRPLPRRRSSRGIPTDNRS